MGHVSSWEDKKLSIEEYLKPFLKDKNIYFMMDYSISGGKR